jgi:hypothetical protein
MVSARRSIAASAIGVATGQYFLLAQSTAFQFPVYSYRKCGPMADQASGRNLDVSEGEPLRHAYGNYDAEQYRQIRIETYGDDLGQTSWTTTEESKEIPKTLGLTRNSYVLEVGCGSRRYALEVAGTVGCRVPGR